MPNPHPSRQNDWRNYGAMNQSEPTVCALVCSGKHFFKLLGRAFSLDIIWCKDINLVPHGVCAPQHGLIPAVSQKGGNQICSSIRGFTRRRPVRTTNDMSRPVRHQSGNCFNLSLETLWRRDRICPRVPIFAHAFGIGWGEAVQ